MPKNRRHIPREERVEELVSVAAKLLLERGYEGTTMPELAATAGVASNNLYWYFASKDDLFAAVMDRVLNEEIERLRLDPGGDDPAEFLVRAIADMRPYRSLHMAMHDRMQRSEAVAQSHERFHDWMRALVREVAARSDTPHPPEMLVDVVVAVFEGANVPGMPSRPASDLIGFLLTSLFADTRRS